MLDLSVPKLVAVVVPRRLSRDIALARKCRPDVVEYRADLQDSPDPADIAEDLAWVKRKLDLPILFTVRDRREGGEFSGSAARRAQLYAAAMSHVDAIDIEIANVAVISKVPHEIEDHEITIVLSYHNFKATPDDEDLDRIVEAGAVAGADAVKIAAHCAVRSDVMRLLSLPLRNDTVPLAVVGMGPLGTAVRMVAPLFGSVLGYASLGTTVAPGQLPVGELRAAWSRLGIGPCGRT